MPEKLRHAIERFPDQEGAIRDLCENNTAFEALTREHAEVSERLQRHAGEGDEHERGARDLQRRRAALEEQMSFIMDQGSRV